MLVREVIEGIESRTILNKDLAEQYGVTGKTVSTKIKRLGFKWIANEMKYEFEGNDEELEAAYNTDWDSLFQAGYRSKQKPIKKPVDVSDTNADKNTKATPKPSQAPKQAPKSMDKIDMLLNTKLTKQQNKTYRGFYLDEDVRDVLDKVGSGNKSELVNECLRVVFESKGLL